MSLSQDLIETFQTLHQEKYGEYINYSVAESQLKDLAELIRLTASKEELQQNG